MLDYEKIAIMGRLSYEGRPFFLTDRGGSKDDRLIFEVLKRKGYEMNEMYTFPNGLTVLVFESEEDVYICFRGTNFFSIKDWYTNFQVYVGKRVPGQFESALRFVEKFKAYTTGKNVYVVGHSLGGAVASYIAQELSYSIDGIITINGCGIAHLGLQRHSRQRVFHLINSHDWLNKYMRWIVGYGRKLDQVEGRIITFKDNKYNSTLEAHGDWSVFMRGDILSDEYSRTEEKR